MIHICCVKHGDNKIGKSPADLTRQPKGMTEYLKMLLFFILNFVFLILIFNLFVCMPKAKKKIV